MTNPATERRRVTRAASAFRIPRDVARRLLAMSQDTRNDVLAELVRVGPGAALAYLRTQPSSATN